MCLCQKQIFHYCSHSYQMGKTGSAELSNIFKLDIYDEGSAIEID